MSLVIRLLPATHDTVPVYDSVTWTKYVGPSCGDFPLYLLALEVPNKRDYHTSWDAAYSIPRQLGCGLQHSTAAGLWLAAYRITNI